MNIITSLNQYFKSLFQDKTVKDASALYAGKFGVYILALISQPLLARLFTPQQFGEFALFNSLLAILLIASNGRFATSILLTRTTGQTLRAFQLSQITLIIFVIFLSLVLLLSSTLELSSLDQVMTGELLLLPLIVLCMGYWLIVQNWLIRKRKYREVSLGLFYQRFLIIAGSVLAYYFFPSKNGLIIGLVAGCFCIFAYAFSKKRAVSFPDFKTLRHTIGRYKDFPLYSVPAQLLNVLTQHLPILFTTYLFSKFLAGNFSIAYLLVNLPFTSIFVALSPLIFERLAQSKDEKRALFLKKTILYTLLFLSPAAIFTAIWGHDIIIWLFGSKWHEAGSIVTLLSPLMLTICLEGLINITLNVSRKQQTVLYFQLAKTTLYCIAFGLGSFFTNSELSFKLLSLFSIIHISCLLLYVRISMYNQHNLSTPL